MMFNDFSRINTRAVEKNPCTNEDSVPSGDWCTKSLMERVYNNNDYFNQHNTQQPFHRQVDTTEISRLLQTKMDQITLVLKGNDNMRTLLSAERIGDECSDKARKMVPKVEDDFLIDKTPVTLSPTQKQSLYNCLQLIVDTCRKSKLFTEEEIEKYYPNIIEYDPTGDSNNGVFYCQEKDGDNRDVNAEEIADTIDALYGMIQDKFRECVPSKDDRKDALLKLGDKSIYFDKAGRPYRNSTILEHLSNINTEFIDDVRSPDISNNIDRTKEQALSETVNQRNLSLNLLTARMARQTEDYNKAKQEQEKKIQTLVAEKEALSRQVNAAQITQQNNDDLVKQLDEVKKTSEEKEKEANDLAVINEQQKKQLDEATSLIDKNNKAANGAGVLKTVSVTTGGVGLTGAVVQGASTMLDAYKPEANPLNQMDPKDKNILQAVIFAITIACLAVSVITMIVVEVAKKLALEKKDVNNDAAQVSNQQQGAAVGVGGAGS